MSLTRRVRPLAIVVTALAVFTLALALSPRSPARAATGTEVTYSLPTVTATPTAPCDVQPCQILGYTMTGTGTTTAFPPNPLSGTFSWTLTPSKISNSNSCVMSQGTGTVDIIWQDNTTTDVTFSFKARDAHTWAIKGQVAASSKPNSAFPPVPSTPASGVVGFPPNPCTGGTVTATLSLFPPVPI